MEPRQCRVSVLEALMGFDEQQSYHHAPRHSRVLSDGYLQRVASVQIAKKKKSSSRSHSFRMTAEEPTEHVSSLKVENKFSCWDELWEQEKAAYIELFSINKAIKTSNGVQDLPEIIDSMDISTRPTREKNYIFNQAENGSSVPKSYNGTRLKDRKQGRLHSGGKLCFSSSSATTLKGSHLVNDKCKDCHDSRNEKHIAKEEKNGFLKHVCSNTEHLHSGSPLCLSLNDKRLDQLSKISHRWRFGSASTVIARSRTSCRYEALRNTWFLKPGGRDSWLRCSPSSRRSNKKNASEPTLKLSSEELRILPCPDSASDHVDNRGCMDCDDQKTIVEKNNLCDYQEGLEEAYQPSPVSVLEPLFQEETLSRSESSGVNGRDLMKQLELLTSDSSETNSEEYDLFVSSDDDDGGQGSICSSDEIDNITSTFKFKDRREFSYLVDVLREAGFNLEKGYASWHSEERHVISPSVFETLEKKLGEQISWRRSERELLFDRINSGLVELFESFVGVPEWAKPVSRRFRFRSLLGDKMIEEEVWIVLDRQEREVKKDLVDEEFGKEIGWIDLGGEIDSICRELERFLVNELVAEFGSI
ncbi:uncharacterized protein LOC111445239 isoform X1 [Cucurbita moschata]|uniref:Uncharacterized protein LOC111445239 isoform X1 n=1 Tax=Cucurbita moschata TaxID=3662 RepID=A0A6J1FFF6_CUCMO|nr:uncharacterized protein LOC111445239 isoform X1 [Cucurbita moschata]XP_022939271.1 uncharacterized protein LOC111445239 isoform X1 [Cucurbita moschata]